MRFFRKLLSKANLKQVSIALTLSAHLLWFTISSKRSHKNGLILYIRLTCNRHFQLIIAKVNVNIRIFINAGPTSRASIDYFWAVEAQYVSINWGAKHDSEQLILIYLQAVACQKLVEVLGVFVVYVFNMDDIVTVINNFNLTTSDILKFCKQWGSYCFKNGCLINYFFTRKIFSEVKLS